jgi:hypothetical protein
MLAWLAVSSLMVAGPAPAWGRRPAARVLVLGFGGQSPGRSFVEILAVQVAASGGQVVEVPVRGTTSGLPARVARASCEVEARGALLGVWLEPDGGPDGRHVLLCLVGRRQGQLLVEVKPVAGRDPRGRPEFERGLAQTTFRWALCSCNSIRLSDRLSTDGYDSTQGPYVPGSWGPAWAPTASTRSPTRCTSTGRCGAPATRPSPPAHRLT